MLYLFVPKHVGFYVNVHMPKRPELKIQSIGGGGIGVQPSMIKVLAFKL